MSLRLLILIGVMEEEELRTDELLADNPSFPSGLLRTNDVVCGDVDLVAGLHGFENASLVLLFQEAFLG